MPRFTILMPTHSRVDVIGHAIQSVLDQTEQDFELLVVGDGCAEGTGDVVSGFRDPRIRFFDLPKAPNFGYANRNIALREARGKSIAFAADDDLWFPDHLEILAKTLAGGAALAYSQGLWVSSDGIMAPFLTNLEFDDERQIFFSYQNTLCANCVVYRADAQQRLDAWPEDVPAGGDWRLWQRIITDNPDNPFAYCRTPTVLHFSARRVNSRHANMPYFATILEVSDSVDWWPAALRATIAGGLTEQSVIAGMMRADPSGWTHAVRQASADLAARFAWDFVRFVHPSWKQIDRDLGAAKREIATLAAHAAEADRISGERLAAQTRELDAMRSERDARGNALEAMLRELETSRRDLDAIRASTSWRLTGPLRSTLAALRRLA